MTPTIAFDVEWSPSEHGPPEIRQTAAFLQIGVGTHIATRVEDDWSQSVHSRVRLSMYPLAQWLASSWWRLRWEPEPYDRRVSIAWRMAHEMPASGGGLIWPKLRFVSDGEAVNATCEASDPRAKEPVRYLSSFSEIVAASAFEVAVDGFLDLVLARLESRAVDAQELRGLWKEVRAERRDPEMCALRKLEAQLGFEPDEAPEDLVCRFLTLSRERGTDAAEEIAPVCAGDDPARVLRTIFDFSDVKGLESRVRLPTSWRKAFHSLASESMEPWQRGQRLAREARQAWGLGGGPVSNEKIAELLQVSVGALASEPSGLSRLPLSLAIRCDAEDKLKLLFRKRNIHGVRFEAVRFIVSHLVASPQERWLPATDAKTARQKLQRAFASEFLCPFEALDEFLAGDLSPVAIEEAAAHFEVSEILVKSHLANHGRIPIEAVVP